MPEDASAAARDPGRERELVYEISCQLIDALVPRGAEWRDVVHEIEHDWDYHAWDIVAVLAMALTLLARTRLSKKGRERLAARIKFRTGWLKAVARLRKKYTAGDDGLSLIAIDGPRPEWERLVTGGKPGDWVLEELLALLLVILARARWPDPPPSEGADPYQQAFTIAFELLKEMGILRRAASAREIEKQRDALRKRWSRVLQRGDLPPRPNDDDPAAWLNAVWQRLLEGPAVPDRRRAPPPAAASPLSLVMEILIAAGGKLQYARVAFDPQFVEHLRRALPSPDLQISFAQAGLLEIITKRGIPGRLERAARGELPTGAPPDPGPSDDTRQ